MNCKFFMFKNWEIVTNIKSKDIFSGELRKFEFNLNTNKNFDEMEINHFVCLIDLLTLDLFEALLTLIESLKAYSEFKFRVECQ
jgi:hypothetical protein